jgi:hypothetical protein
MSLSIPQVQLGKWGTLGYLGQTQRTPSPHSVFAIFFLRIHVEEFREQIAHATFTSVRGLFSNCFQLGAPLDDSLAMLFEWELGSLVRDPERLLRTAAKRVRRDVNTVAHVLRRAQFQQFDPCI